MAEDSTDSISKSNLKISSRSMSPHFLPGKKYQPNAEASKPSMVLNFSRKKSFMLSQRQLSSSFGPTSVWTGYCHNQGESMKLKKTDSHLNSIAETETD